VPWAAAAIVWCCAVGAVAPAWARAPAPAAAATPAAAACPALLQHRFLRLQDERPVDLCQYAGQVVLVVNTASKCGYTRQYESLQTLFQRQAGRGFVILGFPSGDFGGQELASNEAIADFCENQFAVRFPMFTKTTVKPGAAPVNPLFEALAQRTGQRPAWNFHKYLISRDGAQVISIGSDVDPLSPAFNRDLERLLAAR
jgi:glutathione peroxidase